MIKVVLTVVTALVALAACSSRDTKRPASLGGCIANDGVPCSTPSGASAGQASQPDAGSPSGASSGGSVGCGIAAGHVLTMNLSCVPCIVGEDDAGPTGLTDCCAADQACTGACVSLLDCTQGCATTDLTCVPNCENNLWPTGFSAYRDFAVCLAQNCTTQCPTLPQ